MEIVLLSWHLTPPSLFLFNFSFFLFLLLLHLFQSFISLSFLSSFFFCCNSRTYAASNTIALESLSNRYQTDNEAVYSLILNTYHSISRNHCFLLLPTPLLSLAWGLKLSHLPRPDHPQEVNKRGEHRLLIIPLLIHRHNHMIHLPILFFLHHWTLSAAAPSFIRSLRNLSIRKNHLLGSIAFFNSSRYSNIAFYRYAAADLYCRSCFCAIILWYERLWISAVIMCVMLLNNTVP